MAGRPGLIGGLLQTVFSPISKMLGIAKFGAGITALSWLFKEGAEEYAAQHPDSEMARRVAHGAEAVVDAEKGMWGFVLKALKMLFAFFAKMLGFNVNLGDDTPAAPPERRADGAGATRPGPTETPGAAPGVGAAPGQGGVTPASADESSPLDGVTTAVASAGLDQGGLTTRQKIALVGAAGVGKAGAIYVKSLEGQVGIRTQQFERADRGAEVDGNRLTQARGAAAETSQAFIQNQNNLIIAQNDLAGLTRGTPEYSAAEARVAAARTVMDNTRTAAETAATDVKAAASKANPLNIKLADSKRALSGAQAELGAWTGGFRQSLASGNLLKYLGGKAVWALNAPVPLLSRLPLVGAIARRVPFVGAAFVAYDTYKAGESGGTGAAVNAAAAGATTLGTTIVGAEIGAAVGATVGSVVPVLGTAVGGFVGGLIGGFAGGFFGEKVVKWAIGEAPAAATAVTGFAARHLQQAQTGLDAVTGNRLEAAPAPPPPAVAPIAPASRSALRADTVPTQGVGDVIQIGGNRIRIATNNGNNPAPAASA